MYRIFDNTASLLDTDNTPPCQVDYKKDTNMSLIKDQTFDHGRLVGVDYYGETSKTNLILSITITYNEATGVLEYPLNRTTVRKWYDNTGINHNITDFDITTKLKCYDTTQTISEGITRRRNIVDFVFTYAVGLGYSTQATAYMKTHSDEIRSYEVMGDTSIITTVNADTATWLSDIPIGFGGLTMKQIIVGALTI